MQMDIRTDRVLLCSIDFVFVPLLATGLDDLKSKMTLDVNLSDQNTLRNVLVYSHTLRSVFVYILLHHFCCFL